MASILSASPSSKVFHKIQSHMKILVSEWQLPGASTREATGAEDGPGRKLTQILLKPNASLIPRRPAPLSPRPQSTSQPAGHVVRYAYLYLPPCPQPYKPACPTPPFSPAPPRPHCFTVNPHHHHAHDPHPHHTHLHHPLIIHAYTPLSQHHHHHHPQTLYNTNTNTNTNTTTTNAANTEHNQANPRHQGRTNMGTQCCHDGRVLQYPTCGKQITSDRAEVHDKGLEGFLRASIEREDGLQSVFERKRSQLPVPVHGKCRREYIRPCSITSYKRKREEEPLDSDWGTSSSKLRSRTRVFNIKEDCLYCANPVIDYNVETKIPRNRRVRAHDAMTKATLQSVIEKAGDRHDEWGDAVRLRVSNELRFYCC
ncbi:hypothetical protein GWK47_017480 [Chionoecetes opilio]|uniref:Uncharacterized protein n=1 Tax=Chionoecetes opilio TaxID=41210 RepID=A0A8J4XTR7_CHIOP|nr:hypothetical protein GWK47_017480 [Chionoecetes opilio]